MTILVFSSFERQFVRLRTSLHYKYILNMQGLSEKQRRTLEHLKMIIRVGATSKKWLKQMRNSKQRYNILKEWAATEASYIEDLKIIQKNIQEPLKQAKLISDQQQRLLFPNMKAMIHLSENMYACIDATIKAWSPNDILIGENLMVFYKFFMIYREYCNNFMKAQQIVKSLKNNPEAAKIQQRLKLDFESYTIKPVQRPPKYQLLLREYHKCLPKCHKDYNIIKQAIEKYHEVNELNNQSMDRQIRAQVMIKLDKKYGNIISSRTGREYLKQFTCKCVNFKCVIYAFNDMLLLIQRRSDDNEQVFKRLYLDGTSYIAYKTHFKHFENVVFVCGVTKSAHLEFQTFADAEHFYEAVQRIIQNLYRREDERRVRFNENEVRRKNLAKFRVTKWLEEVESKIVYKPKLQIKVESTLKSKGEGSFYPVQFKVIQPFSMAQTVLLTFDNVIALHEQLRSKYKEFEYTKLGMIPEHVGIIEAAKNREKIVEYRSFIIEEFLNLVFRNEELYTIWKALAQQIGLHLDLFQFATSEDFTCTCDLCIQMKENQKVAYYRLLLKPPKKQGKNWGAKSSIELEDIVYENSRSEIHQGNSHHSSGKTCPTYVFSILKSIKEADKSASASFPDRMLALQVQMNQIDYTRLMREQLPLRANITLKVYLLSIEQEYIEITLKQDKYVRQVLEEIAVMNSLDAIYDWGLYLYYEGEYARIPNEERLLEFVGKWGVDIEKTEEEVDRDSFFRTKFDNLKKWGEEFWGGKKGKIFMKKSLHFQHETEISACKANKQRYHFVINEVFGRIKFESMYLTYQQTISMCAFYLLKNEFEKIKHWTEDNVDLTPLKELLPAFYHPYLRADKFRKELMACIRANYAQLEDFQNSRNAIEVIYLKILNFLRDTQEWITMHFKLTTYHGEYLNDVTLCVAFNALTVVRNRDRAVVLNVELQRLKFKTSTHSIFIYEGQSTYRYDGQETHTIRQLIQTYLAYAKMFAPEQ